MGTLWAWINMDKDKINQNVIYWHKAGGWFPARCADLSTKIDFNAKLGKFRDSVFRESGFELTTSAGGEVSIFINPISHNELLDAPHSIQGNLTQASKIHNGLLSIHVIIQLCVCM